MRCEQEIAVGAYLLDALEPDEQLRMREHVERCPVCADTVRELEGVSRLLATVDGARTALLEEAPATPEPSEFAYQRLRWAAAAAPAQPAAPEPPAAPAAPVAGPAEGSRWLSRRVLAVAAAAVVVIGGGGAGIVALSGGLAPPTTVTATASADGIRAQARIIAVGADSLVTLTLDGVPVGERCHLVAVAHDGARSSTRWWQIREPGELTWTDTVDMAPRDIDHLEVVAADGRTLLTLPA